MNSVKKGIKDAIANEAVDIETLMLERKLNALFRIPRDNAEERKGLHASAIIVSDSAFCIREQVLSLFYKRNEEENISDGLLRIFAEGNSIHEKWQSMFKRAGIARAIEDRGYSKMFDLYMTPDAVVEINNKLYVVEIKSANTYSYKSMKDSHPAGTKQLQLYMHFLCIPRGFVLVEDKNTQEFKIFPVRYEPGQAAPYVKRLYEINEAKENFLKNNTLPKRICKSIGCTRASRCAMSNACFGISRKKLAKNIKKS
jgi:CRISPR/Cas system-associated exonuclease Cas4 (RecB family)